MVIVFFANRSKTYSVKRIASLKINRLFKSSIWTSSETSLQQKKVDDGKRFLKAPYYSGAKWMKLRCSVLRQILQFDAGKIAFNLKKSSYLIKSVFFGFLFNWLFKSYIQRLKSMALFQTISLRMRPQKNFY